MSKFITDNQIIEKVKKQLDKIVDLLIEQFGDLPLHRAYVAGGALRDLARDRTPKDYDIYFTNKDDVDKVKAFFETYKETKKTTLLGNTEIEIEYEKDTKYIIQFITLLYGKPDKITSEFDFTINSNYYDIGSDIIYIHKDALGDILHTCNNVSRPLHALYRLETFFKRGYTMPQPDLVKLVEQITNTKISDERLKELTYPISGPKTKTPAQVTTPVFTPFTSEEITDIANILNTQPTLTKSPSFLDSIRDVHTDFIPEMTSPVIPIINQPIIEEMLNGPELSNFTKPVFIFNRINNVITTRD